MMSTSYHHQYNNSVAYSNENSGSLGDTDLPKKKRSHRPRGCRGGGSRRARKASRELQRSDENTHPLFLGKLQLQSKLYSIREGPPFMDASFVSGSGFEDESIHEMPSLHPTDPRMDFGILPSLPPMQRTMTIENDYSHLLLNALPPKPSSTYERPFYSSLQTQNVPTSSVQTQSLYQLHLPPTYTSEHEPDNATVNIVNTSSTIANYPLDTINHHPHHHPAHIQPFSNHTYLIQNQSIQPPADFHRNERIDKQRQMLAGGGSLFLTSPRSFLTGCRNAATSSIF